MFTTIQFRGDVGGDVVLLSQVYRVLTQPVSLRSYDLDDAVFFFGTFPGIFPDFLVAAQKVRDFKRKILDFFQDRLEKSVQKRFRNTRKFYLVMKNTVWRRLRRTKVENKVKTRF